MRAPALAAVVVLAASCLAHAPPPLTLPRVLSLFGISPDNPINKLITCYQTIGSSKCLSALSIWRAEKALDNFESRSQIRPDVYNDVRQFTWEKYANSSQDEISQQLCTGTEKLLRYKPLKLTVPGYELELISKGNGTLSFDVFKGQQSNDSSRGMKKAQKTFYNIVPYLLVPGLIMSAILPFVLPALKLMTVAVGMLNNMALSGAVFTLLRNNAFNDKYEKKVIYVNEGYKNEEYMNHHEGNYNSNSAYEVHYDDKPNHEVVHGFETVQSNNVAPEYFEVIEEPDIQNEGPKRTKGNL